MSARYAGLERRQWDRTQPAVLVTEHYIDGSTAHFMRVGAEIAWQRSLDDALRAIYLHNAVNGHAATPADLRKSTPTTGGVR